MGNQVSTDNDSATSNNHELQHQIAVHVDEMSRFLTSSLIHTKKIYPKGKVLFVGLEKTGKTTLINALCKPAAEPEDEQAREKSVTEVGAVSTIPEGSMTEQPEGTSAPQNPKAATATVAVEAAPVVPPIGPPHDLDHEEPRENEDNNHNHSSAALPTLGKKQNSGLNIPNTARESLPQATRPTEKPQTHEVSLEQDVVIQYIDVPSRQEYHSKNWWTNTLLVDNDKKRQHAMTGHLPTHQKPVHVPLLGIVYVVDVSDRVRFPLVAQELVRIQRIQDRAARTINSSGNASSSSSSSKPFVLIVLNKVDFVINAAYDEANHVSQGVTEEVNDKLLQRHLMNQIRRDLQKNYEFLVRNEIKRATNKLLSLDKRINAGGGSDQVALDSVTWSGLDPQSPGGHGNNNGLGDRNDQPTLMSIIVESHQDDSERIKTVRSTLRDEIMKQLDRLLNRVQ